MDDLTSRLQSILSDPESMKDLAELAAMLNQPDSTDPAPQATSSQNTPPADLPPLDMGKLLAVGQLLGQQQQDANAALLAALKPHLSPERAARAEKAIRLLRLYQLVSVLRESGLLSSMLE